MIKINKVDSNKTNIPQPEASKSGILPTLPASFLVVGKSGSGKSTVLHNLLTNEKLLKDYFDYIFVFSPVKTDDILQQLHLPKENYINDFEEEFVDGIIDKLEKKIEDGGGLGKVGNKTRTLFIFDDILSKAKFLRGNVMRKLASANRHYNISMIINSQYYKAIPPIVRTNVSGIIFFPSCLAEVEKFADEQADPNMSKKEFMDIVRHATNEPYQFMFVNSKAKAGERLRKGFDTLLTIG